MIKYGSSYGSYNMWFLSVVVWFLCSLFGNAYAVESRDKSGNSSVVFGIYFCTKDLENSPSSIYPNPRDRLKNIREANAACNASKEAYVIHNSTIGDSTLISYTDGDGDKCHYLFRHCFLVQAEYLDEITVNGEKLLRLLYMGSRGFGNAGGGNATVYVENIFTKDRYKDRVISCKLVFDKDSLTDDEIRKYGDAEGAMNHKWADLATLMKKETDEGYSFNSHNCCTVAYKVLESIKPDIKKIIDPYKINYGIGVEEIGVEFVLHLKSLTSDASQELISSSEKNWSSALITGGVTFAIAIVSWCFYNNCYHIHHAQALGDGNNVFAQNAY